MRESVAAHRISDVKLGAFLSGGVDSSYITACLMPDETFSVGFASPDGTHKFDETTEAGENIAMGYAAPAAVVAGWMNSEGHRANILNSAYIKIGVGYVADGHYWTQQFIG